MKHTDIVKILKGKDLFLGQNITLCGWVRTVRSSKGICFIELNDGSLGFSWSMKPLSDYSLAQKQGLGPRGNRPCLLRNVKNTQSISILWRYWQLPAIICKRHTLEFRGIAHLRAPTPSMRCSASVPRSRQPFIIF